MFFDVVMFTLGVVWVASLTPFGVMILEAMLWPAE